jgi:hypothetical protein
LREEKREHGGREEEKRCRMPLGKNRDRFNFFKKINLSLFFPRGNGNEYVLEDQNIFREKEKKYRRGE